MAPVMATDYPKTGMTSAMAEAYMKTFPKEGCHAVSQS